MRHVRITCPSCQASYAVPDQLIAGRSRLRCARCGESWALAGTPPDLPPPPTPSAPLVPAVVATPAPQPAPPEPVARVEARPPVAMPLGLSTALQSEEFRKPPARLPSLPNLTLPSPETARFAAWAASLLAVIVFLVILFTDHFAIAQAWPPMARLYALFGLG